MSWAVDLLAPNPAAIPTLSLKIEVFSEIQDKSAFPTRSSFAWPTHLLDSRI